MDISPAFFFAFAGLAVACSLLVILLRNPVSSAFSLVLVFFSFAAIYAMLGAHLIAALQVLVYAGAIMVLFIFVIMLLNQTRPSLDIQRSPLPIRLLSGLVAAALLVCFVVAFHGTPAPAPVGPFSIEQIEKLGGNTQVLSEVMFSEYILPFELTSVLLLAAIVGAVAIAKRKQGVPASARQAREAKSAALGLSPEGAR